MIGAVAVDRGAMSACVQCPRPNVTVASGCT
jgi:hypothetical protein